ncbi:MAG: hypothetical protein M0Z34_05955 [Nitrospiraceae bacterium]|nr:hypothetical protein [Nitrospiraceae bacterium]MDA8262039.1 hypothetical protein [Actinomycetota bacterium]
MGAAKKENLPDRERRPGPGNVAPGEAEEESPSVFFALLVGSASVVAGFAMVRVLARKASPALAPWVIARGTGLALAVVTTLLVCVGLWMTHPKRNKTGGLFHPITLNSAHKTLAGTGAVLLFIHISAIIADGFAKVGAVGAFVPLMSSYRPVPVALGTLALYSVLAVGVTAWLKVRVKLFNWKMVHRYAVISFILIMIHGITAGTDTATVAGLYIIATLAVTAMAVTRYHFDRPATRPAPRPPRPPADLAPEGDRAPLTTPERAAG